jgi:uncharacterized protein
MPRHRPVVIVAATLACFCEITLSISWFHEILIMPRQSIDYSREFERTLTTRLAERLNFIQIVIGPRQVGKTTGVRRVFDRYEGPKHFASADSPVPMSADWLKAQWDRAWSLGPNTLLVVDEVQKIGGWAEVCKLLFDEHRSKRNLKVVLLGSASLSIQDGLSAALTGRFELIPVTHWDIHEMQQAFQWDLETYLKFGGYPAAAELASDFERWRSFVRDSIIEPVLGRDISGLVRIGKPALFRQAFQLVMSYPAQTISYQKLLGQLQEGGNASTVKNYLELFQGAYLVKLLEKFSVSPLSVAASSPKIIPLAPALCNAMLDREEMLHDATWRGRIFEAVVGTQLLKQPGKLFYWSEGNYEVDFVRQVGRDEIVAYEVKSGLRHKSKSLEIFKSKFPGAKIEIIDRATVEGWMESASVLLRG